MRNYTDYLKLLHANRLSVCPDCDVDLMASREGEYKCPRCGKYYYDDLGRIRNYLEENPGSSIRQISEGAHVDRKTIQAYIEYCHLEYTGSSNGFQMCSICGAPLRCGTICPNCAAKSPSGSFDPLTVGAFKYGSREDAALRTGPDVEGYFDGKNLSAEDNQMRHFKK